MLKKENKQKDFFDSYVYERLLPEKHILLNIKNSIDFSFVENETNDVYSQNMGRPSFPPVVLFKILFLEFFCNLSDYAVVDQVKTNVLFRYFVGLSISSPTPDHTTLSVFRKRLGVDRFKRLFDRVVLQARDKGLVDGKLKILDATHIQANVAIQSAVNLLRHGRKILVKKISRIDPIQEALLRERYLTEEKMRDTPAANDIKKELDITSDFIRTVKDRFDSDDVKDMIDLLETALGQQQRKVNNQNHKEPDEIVNFTDKDARRGAKSKKKRFVGYKVHTSMDEGSNIITSARTIPGNRNEGNRDEVKQLLDEDASKEVTHEAVAADSLYDSRYNRQNIHSRNMRAFITNRDRGRKKNLDNFTYDHKEDTIICPNGHSSLSKSRQDGRDMFIFSRTHCGCCDKVKDCPKLNEGRVRLYVSDNYRLSILDNVPEKKGAFVKRRDIERKFGEAKVWHKLQRTRYREWCRVAIQVFMTFIAVNMKRMAALLMPKTEYTLGNTGYG